LKTLVDAGADATVIDNDGWNVLMNILANPSRYKRELDEDTIMKMVNILTEKVIDINYEAPDGMNALNVALLCGQLDVAKKIKGMMKKPESNTNKGPKLSTLSCLCLARVKESDVDAQKELVGELLDADYDALSQDDKGQNALHIACLYRRFDLAKELITRCKNATDLLSAKDHQGYTPLHYAVTHYAKTALDWSLDAKPLEEFTEKLRRHYGHFDSYDIDVSLSDVIDAAALAAEGVKDSPSVLDAQSKNGETLLHVLCRSYQTDRAPVVKQLLVNSANPDIQDNYGQTPLLISCFNLDVKVVKKLLKRKVNVNAADMHGVTPALALCYGVNREIEELNYHKVNSYRLSATVERQLETSSETLIAAFREIFALLVKHNADFTAKDKLIWRTPLHILAGVVVDVSDQIEQLVKELKVDINARDIRNDAATHFAVRKYCAPHLRKLLELGADINAIGSSGQTVMHAVFKLSDYSSFKGNGELMRGGFKLFGHSLVYYTSWIWNSAEDGTAPTGRRYSVRVDTEEKDLTDTMIVTLFEHADKINFGIKDSEGALPIQLMCDNWREDENLSAIFLNSPVVKKLLTPLQLHLPLPNLFVKFATKEQLSAEGTWAQTMTEAFVRIMQIFPPPNQVPKEATIQLMKDIIAKGVEPFDDSVIRAYISSSRDIYPEIIEMIFQHTPRAVLTAPLARYGSRTTSTVLHYNLGNKSDHRTAIKDCTAVLMKYVPELLNAYDGQGRTPLIESVESNTYNANEEKVTKLSITLQVLLAQPGIEVNKQHRENGKTALHYAAMFATYASMVGLFYNNINLYNNVGVDLALLALLDAGADVTIKDKEGKTPVDILPALEQIAKERRKLLLREEKLSLIDKPVIMIDTKNQQNNALVKAFNIDKLHTYVEPNNNDDDENGFM
jgi:ankyrin repeat protein